MLQRFSYIKNFAYKKSQKMVQWTSIKVVKFPTEPLIYQYYFAERSISRDSKLLSWWWNDEDWKMLNYLCVKNQIIKSILMFLYFGFWNKRNFIILNHGIPFFSSTDRGLNCLLDDPNVTILNVPATCKWSQRYFYLF